MILLSIIIPVYNSEKTIGRTLESLKKISEESMKLTEVVIIDDGSKDKSMETVRMREQELFPHTFITIRQENRGSAAARNKGLSQCQGEWIFFLDADDELAIDPVPFILKSEDVSSIGFSMQWYKRQKKWRVMRPTFITMQNHLDICTASVPFSLSNIIFKKDHITSMFDERLLYLEDWVFWIQNPSIFRNIKMYKNLILANIYAHGENKSSNYVMVGEYREKIAGEFLRTIGEKLTRKQKNNLIIQAQIGVLLQGGEMKVNNFFRFPCNMTLFGKLIIYVILRKKFSKVDIYGQ